MIDLDARKAEANYRTWTVVNLTQVPCRTYPFVEETTKALLMQY